MTLPQQKCRLRNVETKSSQQNANKTRKKSGLWNQTKQNRDVIRFKFQTSLLNSKRQSVNDKNGFEFGRRLHPDFVKQIWVDHTECWVWDCQGAEKEHSWAASTWIRPNLLISWVSSSRESLHRTCTQPVQCKRRLCSVWIERRYDNLLAHGFEC